MVVYEAHIPFIQRFFIDYNLHGMSFLHIAPNADGFLHARVQLPLATITKVYCISQHIYIDQRIHFQ